MAPDSYALKSSKTAKRGWFDWLMGKDTTTTITIPRFPTAPGEMSLADSLQYGASHSAHFPSASASAADCCQCHADAVS